MTTWILCHQLKKGKLELPYNFGRLNQAHSVDSHAFGSRSRRCSTATFLMTYTCSSWGWQAEGFCSLNKMFSWQEKKRDKMNSSIAKGAEVVERLLSQLQLWQRCSFLPQPWGLTLPPILLLAQESRERCRAKCNHAVLPWKEFFPRKHMHNHLPWLHTAAQQRLCHQHCWTVPHSAWPSSLSWSTPEITVTAASQWSVIYFLVSFMYFLPPTRVQHSITPEQPSPGKLRPKLAACAALSTGFTAGMENQVLTRRDWGSTLQRT